MKILLIIATFCCLLPPAYAEDKIELKITTIRGNKELPQILYIVPWQGTKKSALDEQNIVLHSLFGDLFDPFNPEESAIDLSDISP